MKDINATIIINLKDTNEKELFNRIRHSRRKNIKTSQKNNLTLTENVSENDIEEVYKIYKKTWISGGATPEDFIGFKKRIQDPKFKLLILKKENKIIGSSFIEFITKEAYSINSSSRGIRFHAFSSDELFNDFRPNDAMYWNTICFALKNNFDFVDLGGWQINARGHLRGINKFKENWGGEIFYYSKDYPFFRAIGRKLIRNLGIFWWLNKKIKNR